MAVYVLVHGAWHGGWCWQRVVPLLRAYGHEVFSPTLTGLGERSHLAGPQIDLSMHIQDVFAVLDYEDLRHVILLGHSYGGMVITGVADRAGDRLSHLVYLDAFVPRDGQAMIDFVSQGLARYRREEWRVFPFAVERYGVIDEADKRWVGPKLVPQPEKTLTEPLRLAGSAASELPKTYVYCSSPPMGVFEQFAHRAKAEGWRYHELKTGHDAMVTEPRLVADILLGLA